MVADCCGTVIVVNRINEINDYRYAIIANGTRRLRQIRLALPVRAAVYSIPFCIRVGPWEVGAGRSAIYKSPLYTNDIFADL